MNGKRIKGSMARHTALLLTLSFLASVEGDILVSVAVPNENRSSICKISVDSFSLEKAVKLTGRFVTGPGVSKDGALLACGDQEVCRSDLETGVCTAEFSYSDAEITDSEIRTVWP